ncbi:periplasmic binding protein-like II [Piromyces finnis]|uniref:Periplasmic binding protein-like II n=1 Tax=Piromyces finnis TaxID=1754191 RepID=A0A1Y1VJV3_9FUNG|nr:periplasmic binding protein-like II [Piromyces finnis]|eukprot:ORX58371.1 periplasmic binding protein-like II [Piromyces finnis]
MDISGLTFKLYVDEFNNYSKEKNLDIDLKLNLLTMNNFSVSMVNSNMMFESLLKKKKSSYDIYFFDASWTRQYCPYFVNLSKYLEKDHINKFNENIISQLCFCDDHLIGLPLILGYEGLYSNIELLKKYNKRVPKTWKELLDTGKEILEKERELNNTELIGYNGEFFDNEVGLCSIYEFIHSSRETIDSPFPDLRSKEVLDAVLLLKEIKEEISSDEIFTSNLDYAFSKLQDGKAIFLKFYVYFTELIRTDSPYEMTSLPGINEGVSSTILTGYNIGIANNLDEEKLESALKVVKYLTSREVQKKLVLQNMIISAMTSIYDDEEVCANIKNCKMFRDAQPIAKPVDKTKDFNEYAARFSEYFYSFLYNNEDASTILRKIDDLARVYFIQINSKETSIGLIIFTLLIITIPLILLSLIFIHINKFSDHFSFLSKPSWYLIIIGIVVSLSSGFTKFGMISDIKCHLNDILFYTGYSIIYIPILCKLIISFPEENKYSKWISENRYKFVLMLFSIYIILNGLTFIDTYDIEDIIVNEGQNFQICAKNRIFTKLMYLLIIGYNIIIILSIFLLIFIEWNLKIVFYDIRFVLTSLYLSIITFAISSVFNILKIQNYILYFILYECSLFIISIINYLTLYGIRLLLPRLMKRNSEMDIIEKIRVHESSYEKSENIQSNTFTSNQTNSITSRVSGATNTTSKSNSLYSKIVEYHYSKHK